MKVLKFIWYWFPPVALMSLIFYYSSKQNISVSESTTIDFLVFKSIHIAEYAVLTFLFFRAYALTFTKWQSRKVILFAAVSALLYGIVDEVHQTFVPTRTGQLSDVFIDLIGISIMVMYTDYYSKQIRANLK